MPQDLALGKEGSLLFNETIATVSKATLRKIEPMLYFAFIWHYASTSHLVKEHRGQKIRKFPRKSV